MRFASTTLIAFLPTLASGQNNATPGVIQPVSFDIADVHVSAKSVSPATTFPVRNGHFEIRRTTMLNLIQTAYGFDTAKIVGGPSWLEIDRFDVIATAPPRTSQESAKLMLQSLLAERFKLVVRNETKDLAGFALIASKKPQLKEASGSGEPGCRYTTDVQKGLDRAESARTTGIMVPILPDFNYTCHSETMRAFADGMRRMPGAQQYLNDGQVGDRTNIEGAWDFSFEYTQPPRGGVAPSGATTLFAAMEKLGLKLEPMPVPSQVLRVVSANQTPTPNPPEVATRLSLPPAEFEVADIRPVDPNAPTLYRINFQPSGRFEAHDASLRTLIGLAWEDDFSDDDFVGLPKFADTAKFDVVAKATTESNLPLDYPSARLMIRALLVERFKMATHTEDRPKTSYNLTAAKPKLQKADPSNRAGCRLGTLDPKNTSTLPKQLFNCQNVNMAEFADQLQHIAPSYIRTPVVDMTGLDGAYDFTISFTPAEVLNTRPGGDALNPSEPTGAVSLFDALGKLGLKLEQTKRPAPVLVIDRIEEKPTEN